MSELKSIRKKIFKKIWRPPPDPLYLCIVIQIQLLTIHDQNKMKKSIFTLLMAVTFVAFTATAQTADKQTTEKSKLENCPLKGTPDCPLVKNCPKKERLTVLTKQPLRQIIPQLLRPVARAKRQVAVQRSKTYQYKGIANKLSLS